MVLRRLMLVVVLGAGALGISNTWANGPEVISTGATLIPVRSSAVRLVLETVHIDLPVPLASGGRVECDYHLKNTIDESVAFSMAFVTAMSGQQAEDVAEVFKDSGFRVVADGHELPSRLQPISPEDWEPFVSDPPESLRVWDLSMPPGGEIHLNISYNVWPAPREDSTGTWYTFTYPARPASLWAGEVAAAEFIFTVGGLGGPLLECLLTQSDCVTARIAPEGYAWTGQGLSWRFINWEPDRDFEVSLRVPDVVK